jgi:hypothetical protein
MIGGVAILMPLDVLELQRQHLLKKDLDPSDDVPIRESRFLWKATRR